MKKEKKTMTYQDKFESTVKYLMESEGYSEFEAQAEAFRILVAIASNKRK
jgi:hypothetical protein